MAVSSVTDVVIIDTRTGKMLHHQMLPSFAYRTSSQTKRIEFLISQIEEERLQSKIEKELATPMAPLKSDAKNYFLQIVENSQENKSSVA